MTTQDVTTTAAPVFDWRKYQGPAVRDPRTRSWLVWRATAAAPGYYPAACPSVAPATARRDAAKIADARALAAEAVA